MGLKARTPSSTFLDFKGKTPKTVVFSVTGILASHFWSSGLRIILKLASAQFSMLLYLKANVLLHWGISDCFFKDSAWKESPWTLPLWDGVPAGWRYIFRIKLPTARSPAFISSLCLCMRCRVYVHVIVCNRVSHLGWFWNTSLLVIYSQRKEPSEKNQCLPTPAVNSSPAFFFIYFY